MSIGSSGRPADDASAPLVSVVLATFERRASAERLLGQLAAQTLDPDRFEVVVVDDGSTLPAAQWLGELRLPFRLTALRQPNAGAAAARHRGVLSARGELVVILDDDMQVAPGFLEAHLAPHQEHGRLVVVGRIRASAGLARMPLFERFHQDLLDRWSTRPLHGDALYTGNMSLRRSDYLAVGGFDTSFERAEDIDLGLRLERSGVAMLFSEAAQAVHESDHTDFAAWRRRATSYGRCGVRLARKYPELVRADPWAGFFGNAALKRPLVAAALLHPAIGRLLSAAAHASALSADRIGLTRLALRLTSLLWELEYFGGVRQETGGLAATIASCAQFVAKLEAEPDDDSVTRGKARGWSWLVRWLGARRPPA